MPKIVEINLKGNTAKVYANNNTIMYETCKILGNQHHCLNLGSTFSTVWVSKNALFAAQQLGINLSSNDVWSQMQSKRHEIIQFLENYRDEARTPEVQNGSLDSVNTDKNIVVTTGDLKEDYDIIGPVYFQVSNKGIFSNELSRLIKKHSEHIHSLKKQGHLTKGKFDWGFLYGEFSVGQNDFDKAFFVAVEELKLRAKLIGGDAIICMRQDIDLDTTNIQRFYLQIYGTAVKFKQPDSFEQN